MKTIGRKLHPCAIAFNKRTAWTGGVVNMPLPGYFYKKGNTYMERMMSCCGVFCSECEYYPSQCKGCEEIRGKVFWGEYIGQTICEKYDCCVNQKKLPNCGKCGELPCRRYELDDPNLSPEENDRIRAKNIKLLKSL